MCAFDDKTCLLYKQTLKNMTGNLRSESTARGRKEEPSIDDQYEEDIALLLD